MRAQGRGGGSIHVGATRGSQPVKQKNLLQESALPSAERAKPFVKWVGGKRSLLPELLRRVPADFNNYYEPFVGGGALFFALKNEGRLDLAGGGRTFLSDINFDLINTYQVIQRDPAPLIAKLRHHQANHSKEYYYQIRSQHQLDERVDIAARFIYLNKTCYNGLWRVNSKGEFNVPVGSAEKPAICQANNLRDCHASLRNVDVRVRDFRQLTASKGDFVYFDPPYDPLAGGSFTDYTRSGFGKSEQVDLRDYCRDLHAKGVRFMLSNSATDFIHALYSDSIFKIRQVKAPRMVNCKADKRGAVSELLVSNYWEE